MGNTHDRIMAALVRDPTRLTWVLVQAYPEHFRDAERVTIYGIFPEHPLPSRGQPVGFIDILTFVEVIPKPCSVGEDAETPTMGNPLAASAVTPYPRRFVFAIEIKPGSFSLGEVLRQVKTYRCLLERPGRGERVEGWRKRVLWIVCTPYNRYADILEQEGICLAAPDCRPPGVPPVITTGQLDWLPIGM